MPYKVAAFYQFAALPDFRTLREPLHAICARLDVKSSAASAMAFPRLKVRLKKEIVTLGDTEADPTRQVGIYVDPANWNDFIAAPDTLLLYTRNAFEVAIGEFGGA